MSKYYPMANYSYPRKESFGAQPGQMSPLMNRSSLGSEGSAPGLIDDQTDDSEVSAEDDYQYHSHATELWDSFWPADRKSCEPVREVETKKQYPALLPSNKSSPADQCRRRNAWPLANASSPQSRRPAATYSAFPKSSAAPPRSTSLAPSGPACEASDRPQRPPRPNGRLLPPSIDKTSPIIAAFSTGHSPSSSTVIARPLTPNERQSRPVSPLRVRPATSHAKHKPTASQAANTIIVVPPQPSPGLPPPSFQFPASQIKAAPTKMTRPDIPPLQPQSFFDWDDDSDEEDRPDSATRFLFKFHKRGDSDSRRSGETSYAAKKRSSAKTAPNSPSEAFLTTEDASKRASSGKKRQGDYFHRMLGRRSR